MGTPIVEHGLLRVAGARLVNKHGQPIQLRGASSAGINFHPQTDYINPENIRLLRNGGANVIRLARYVVWGEDPNELITNKQALETVVPAIREIIDAGMYVIVDWHVLKDRDPLFHEKEALEFFLEIYRCFADDADALIFEIANEPNDGNGQGKVTWASNIKPYADRIIRELRHAGVENLILVPTSNYCQNPSEPSEQALDDSRNVMYTAHFYASDRNHREHVLPKIEAAIQAGIPLFISEWGSSDAQGSGQIVESEIEVWMNLLNHHGLSWVYWWFGAMDSASRNESSAALRPGAPVNGPYELADWQQSGRILMRLLQARA